MSGRCIACDEILTEFEMKITDEDGKYTNMCNRCKRVTYLAENGYYDDANTIDGLLFDYSKSEVYKE